MDNWINALDWCAASGVINYDAPAFILGQNPRYVGHPNMGELPMSNDLLLPPGVRLKDLPKSDSFNTSDGNLVHNPAWKKALFGAVTIAGLIGGGIAIFKLGKIKLPKISMPKLNIKNPFKNLLNFVKKPFVWLSSKFTKAGKP